MAKLGNDVKRARDYINSPKFEEICNIWMKRQSDKNRPNPEITAKYQLLNVSNLGV